MSSITPADVAVGTTGDGGGPRQPGRVSLGGISLNLRSSGIYIAFALIIVLFSVLTTIGAAPRPSRRRSRS